MDDFQRRLELAISLASTPTEVAELRLRLAIVETRFGRFDAAKREVKNIRDTFGDGNHPRISILILLTEGLIMYFQSIRKDSIKKIHLASELSKSMRINDLCAITNSWLAHLYYNFDQYEKLANSISLAIDLTDNLRCDWIARISLTIGDTLQLSGDWKEADVWYRTAQRHSTLDGDRLTLGAIIFNRIAVGLSKVRAEYALKNNIVADWRRWTTEASSAEYYHLGLSMSALPELLKFCSARALFLEGRFAEAEDCYRKILEAGHSERCGVNDAFMWSEIAMCKILSGELIPGINVASHLHPDDCDSLAIDDKMIFHTNLIEIHNKRNSNLASQELGERVSSSIRAYCDSSKTLSTQIAILRPKLHAFSQLLDSHTH